MIRAEGNVVFLVNDERDYHPNDIYIHNKNLLVIVTSSKNVVDSNNRPAIELVCSYKLNLEEKYYCHTPNDYVGQVYPELRKSINRILMTQVINIDKMFHNHYLKD
ncbi:MULTISPECIES: hypothetical protein [Bacillus]|uniref:hypothetical protein n=1 Tax=Bacillus TaxID=1386 RepID=UPI0002E0C194|nr:MULTISPECIES: hypothetical protein [Bacillus]